MRAERFESPWRDSADGSFEQVLRQSFCDMDCRSGRDGSVWGVTHFAGISLHGISLFKDEGIGLRRGARTRRHIRSDGAQDFLLTLPVRSRMTMRQAGTVAHCEPGHMMLVSTSMPFSGALAPAMPGGRFSELAGKVSGALLRRKIANVDDFSNRPVRIDSSAGKFLHSLFDLALIEGKRLSEPEMRHLGELMIHALVDVVAESPESRIAARDAQKNSLTRTREKALAYIWQQLSNPALDCGSIAAHCEVSASYLHAAFAAASLRTAACIREQRLEQCRIALRDPALLHRSIVAIALSWGFADPATFSRAYKSRYGLTPAQERDLARMPQAKRA